MPLEDKKDSKDLEVNSPPPSDLSVLIVEENCVLTLHETRQVWSKPLIYL